MAENTNYNPKVSRIVNRDGKAVKMKRSGIKRISRNDLYVNSLASSWFGLIFAIVLFYTIINTIFAGLYLIQDGAIENARAGSFKDAFFFSVQTLATIGYGKMVPATSFANILVAIEALVGLSGLAVVTGVIFSKISKPSARILFGNNALISSYKNSDCFIFRLGNLRTSQIVDPIIKAVFICDELLEDGSVRRAFHDLKLIRNNVPILMPSWTLRHQIDKYSPLLAMKKEDLERKNIEIIVSLIGFDETLSQNVHAHHSYIASEIKFGGDFVDIITWNNSGHINVDYKRFHDVR
jgi:inward rectifier potassium channel